jgi:Mg-chelatase subunit ChlD
MSFLTPLFWLGAAAVALPVLFHLIRRTTREQTIFSSLMFLLPSPPRLTRRSRLEHILLLLLRCLVLCLLAAAFARPFIRKAMDSGPSDGAGMRMVVLVDSSASMRRANLWADARERVESVLRKSSPSDQVAVYTFDRQLTPVVSFEQWAAVPSGERVPLVKQKLGETSPGWSSTYLGNALIQAAEMLGDASGQPPGAAKEIVLISDLQEGSRLEQLQGYEWPKQIRVSVEALKPKHINNAGLQLVTDSEISASTSADGARVRVSNAENSRLEQF